MRTKRYFPPVFTDRRVAVTDDLKTARNGNRNVAGCAVSRVIVKRKPTRRIHQITVAASDIREPFRQKRSALCARQNSGVFKTQSNRRTRRNHIAEINAHVRTQIRNADLILHKSYFRQIRFDRRSDFAFSGAVAVVVAETPLIRAMLSTLIEPFSSNVTLLVSCFGVK